MAKKKTVSVGYRILDDLQKNTERIGQTQKTTNGYGYSILSRLEKETKEMEARSQAIAMLGAQSRSGFGLPLQQEKTNDGKKTTSASDFWETPAQEQIRLAEELQPDPATLPGTVGRQMLDLATKKVEDTLAGKFNLYAPASNPFQPVTKQDSGATEETKKNAYPKARESKYVRKKADAILQGMMENEEARAKDEYEAAYLAHQRAEENYYAVPDGDFQKAEDDYLAAEERLRKAESQLRQAGRAARETAESLEIVRGKDAPEPAAEKDPAAEYFTGLLATNSWAQESNDSAVPNRGMGRYSNSTPGSKEKRIEISDLESAKEEREAAYLEYQKAEENYYAVPDGDFQKAQDNYLAADARLQEAESRVKQLEQDLQAQEDEDTYNKYKAMIASLSEKEFEALLASNDQDDTMSYGYLLKQGYSRYDINAMYETLLRGLNAEMSENVLGSVYDFAGQNFGTGAVGFAGARAGQFLGGFTGTAQVILDTARHYFQGSPYHGTDPNGPGYLPSRAAAAADQGASDAIEGEDGNFLRKAAAFVYRGAANAADNLVRMAIASAVGGGSLYGAKINSAFSFTQGFQGSYRESQEKAGSPIQGWLVGSVDGGMEVFTESRTFERWMNLKDPELIGKDAYAWLKSAAVGIGNEITEEEASYIANTIADAVVMADKSESAEFIKDAVAAGKTPAEAKWELAKKYAHEMAVTAADTAMSTLLMDAGTGAVAKYQHYRQYRSDGKSIIQNQAGQELVQAAKDSGVDEQVRNLAMEKASGDYEAMSAWKRAQADQAMGKLYEQTIQAQEEQANQAVRESFQQAAEEKIRETQEAEQGQEQEDTGTPKEAEQSQSQETNGTTQEDPKKAAEALTKAAYGEDLTDAEKKTVEAMGGEALIEEIVNSREFQEAASARTEEATRRLSDTLSMTRDTTQQRELVSGFAKENGMDEGVLLESIRRNQDAYAFTEAWQSAYDMGQSGVALRYAQKASANSYLTQEQIETAYNEGRKAAASYEAEESALPDGGQWNDRAYPGGQVRAVEGGTAAQGQQIQQGAGGGIAEASEKITSIQLGIENGTENRNLRRVAEAAYSEEVKAAAKVAKDSGLVFVPFSGGAIETWETVNGNKIKVKSRGCVVNGKMFVRVDDNTFTADQIARHEAAHEQIRKGEIDVEDARQRLLEGYSPEEIEAIIQLYASAYGDSGLTAEEVLEEIICDSMGKMNAFATESTERVAGEVGVFLRNLRKAAKNTGAAKNTTGEGGVKYSIQFTKEMSWEEQLRAKRKGSLRTSDSFYLGMTPDVYGDDFSGYPLVMNQSDFKKSATEKHNVPNRVFRRLPELLSNPVMSFNRDGRTAVVLDDIDADGKPLVAALHSGEQMDRKTVTAVTSVYGIDNWKNWIANQAKKKITIHNEIRAESMLQTYGSNASVEDAIRSIEGIVSQNEGGVKQKYSRELDSDGNKLTAAQADFFKDSKIRDEDGNLRVVYHGTDAEFTVFDMTKTRANMDIQGSFFSPWDMDAGGYGGNVKAYYLNIKKPAPEGIGYKALNRFKGQNGAGVKAREYLESLGYDGVNNGDEEYIAFYPEQIKLISNQNPTTNKDIRYSREMDTVKALERQVELLREQRDYWKDQTRLTKVAKADKDSVRKLGRELLRGYSSRTNVEDILTDLQWLADDAVGQPKASFDEVTDRAEKVARKVLEGSEVDVNADAAEIRKELKKYLKDTPIKVTESIKAGIPDFSDFKKRNRALHFREDGSGTDVDVMWLELQDQFGTGMFPESIMNQEDQVRYIAEELEDIREVMVNPYGMEMELAIQQLTYDILYRTSFETQQKKPTRADKAVERATKEMQQLLEEGRRRETARIENAQKTSIRQQIRSISDKFQRMATRPGKGITQHAPEGLRKAVVDFCEVFTESELRRMDRWQRNLEYRADELGRKASNVNVATGVVAEAEAIQNAQARRDRMTARLTKLQNAYEAMKKDGQYQTTYDETVAEMIKNLSEILGEEDLYQLDIRALRKVQQTMSAIYYTITNANKAFSMGKDKSIIDMAVKWAKEIRQVNPKQAGMMIAGRRFLQWQMSPDTFFSYTCGYIKGNEGKVIQKGFQQGAERMMGVQREFYQMFREFTESKDKAVHKELADLMNYSSKRLVNWGLKDLEGNEVKTPRGMMIQAYMLLNQADSFESLKHGGFSIPNAARYYKGDIAGAYGDAVETTMLSESIGTGYTEMIQRNKDLRSRMEDLQQKIETSETERYKQRYQQEINELEKQIRENQQKMEAITSAAAERLYNLQNAIEKQLTPLEKKLIDRAHEWYSKSGQMMADVFEQMYGYRPILVENYVPIHRDQTTIKTDIRDMAGAEKAFNLENSGFTIDRVKNSQPILLTDFFEELYRQSDKMARYVGFAQVQKDFGKIWKTRIDSHGMTVNTLVRARFGAGKSMLGVSGEEYVNHYIADLAGGHSSDDILGKLYGNYAAATLRFNPRVAVSQAASIPTAASVVGWKSMAAGFARGVPKAWNKDYRNELAAKNEWFYQRYRGNGGITEISDIKKKGGIFETIANSKIGKLLFNWCQSVDVWATGSIMWSAAEDYVQSQGIAKGSAEYEAEVNRVYTDIIRKSQPNYTTTERSDMLRDQRSHMKLLTMFKTQSNQNLNLLLEANGEFIRMRQDLKNGRNGVTESDVKAARHKLCNAATGVVVGGQLAFVLLRTLVNFAFRLVKPYRDEETDEVTLEATLTAMGKEFLSAMFGTVALGGEIYDVINSVWSGDNFYGLNDSALSTISGVVENSVNILQSWKDEDESVTMNQIWKEVNSLCTVLKIPSGNVKKYVFDMVKSYGTDIKKGDLLAFTSEDTTNKQYRARIVKHYLAGDEDKAADAMTVLWERGTKDTDEENRKQVAGDMRTYLKELYKSGDVSNVEAEKIMDFTGTEDPKTYTTMWDLQLAHPDREISESIAKAYNTVDGKIPEEVFLDAWEFAKNAQADKDKNGKTINGSKKQKVVDHIEGLTGLSKSQKKALYVALNVGSVKGTPWE